MREQKPQNTISPAQLRGMFGANLRRLVQDYPSVASLCRDLDINRTQFNRYLSGESFPRPDVLHRICRFFGVDARILLEPHDRLTQSNDGFLSHPQIEDSFGPAAAHVDEDRFPSGFYSFSRRSFVDESRYVRGLVRVYRDGNHAFVKGYEARAAMREQGLPETRAAREFRGFIMAQEDGVALMIARHGANTGSFNFLARVPAFQNTVWEGYVSRTTRETLGSQRATRMVYEYLGTGVSRALGAARQAGYCRLEDLLPFHQRLLRANQPFR